MQKSKLLWRVLLLFIGTITAITLIYYIRLYYSEKEEYFQQKALYEQNVKLYELGIKYPEKAHIYARHLYNADTPRSVDGTFFKGDFDFQKEIEDCSRARGKAFELYLISAQKGNVHSQVFLADYYKSSYHSELNSNNIQRANTYGEQAAHWYFIAAKKGSAYAQGELGNCYKLGIGVTQNFEKAIYWTKLGVKNGDAKAAWRLGNLYESGLAYYKDYADRLYWYEGKEFLLKGWIKRDLFNDEKTIFKVYLEQNQDKAEYYWQLANNRGYQENRELGEVI